MYNDNNTDMYVIELESLKSEISPYGQPKGMFKLLSAELAEGGNGNNSVDLTVTTFVVPSQMDPKKDAAKDKIADIKAINSLFKQMKTATNSELAGETIKIYRVVNSTDSQGYKIVEMVEHPNAQIKRISGNEYFLKSNLAYNRILDENGTATFTTVLNYAEWTTKVQ